MKPTSRAQQNMEALSKLMFEGYADTLDEPVNDPQSIQSVLQYVASLSPTELTEFFELANSHHVLVRALSVLKEASQRSSVPEHRWIVEACSIELEKENARVQYAVGALGTICDVFESHGCRVAVIKSLDHWPDLGSDLDLYTDGDPDQVVRIMSGDLKAKPEERSWGDRLANKWNFNVPGLPELVEIHVQYLGQTGEHKRMAHRVIERRTPKTVGGRSFLVAAPEERILISTLQRMYRHFYFRLCDMADTARLVSSKTVNFEELQEAAKVGGIWTGVATYLFLVAKYVEQYGLKVVLPGEVIASTCSPHIRVHFEDGFLRVPKLPAAGLYGSQLWKAGLHRDFRAVCRLPLLPPLAVSALVAYRLTGSDKGVW